MEASQRGSGQCDATGLPNAHSARSSSHNALRGMKCLLLRFTVTRLLPPHVVLLERVLCEHDNDGMSTKLVKKQLDACLRNPQDTKKVSKSVTKRRAKKLHIA